MESSSASTRSRLSRFRDREEMEDAARSNSVSEFSSASNNQNGEDEVESMTGKGIKHLCSELFELKAESYEDFHGQLFSNYSAFIRIFDQVQGMENEVMLLKTQILTQKSLVEDLDEIHLKFLSEEIIESIILESESAEGLASQSKLEAQIDNFSDAIDTFLLENRIDEAIDAFEMEDDYFQRVQCEDALEDLLMLYNSTLSEKKDMLILHLTLTAENPRISAAELQKALLGLFRLGNSHLAIQLLLKYYHSRIATGVQQLQRSKFFLHGLYMKELAKFVFSMISQAARGFVMLYGEPSPYAAELIHWAREEIKVFVASINMYFKSISEVSGVLFTAVQALQSAISYCSLLETQRLMLKPCLIKHIRPCMEEVLQIRVDHLKKVLGIFIASDTWVLERYLLSGILKEWSSSMDYGQQPEYCLLTNSGRQFVTLLQDMKVDIAPFLSIRMESSIVIGVKELYLEYVVILEKAITDDKQVSEIGSIINVVESLPQQVSMLANLSSLQQLLFNILRSFFGGACNLDSKPIKNLSIQFQQKELDACMLSVQEATTRFKAHFFQKYINRMMSMKTGFIHFKESDSRIDASTFTKEMPSSAFQVLYLDLRKLDQLCQSIYETDWLMELLRELMESIFVWISSNKEIWASSEENLPVQLSDIFSQFVLDIHFLVEIVKRRGYFSKKPLVLVTLIEAAFISAGLDPKRDMDEYAWAKYAAAEAIEKLLEIEQLQLYSENESGDDLEEELHENLSETETELVQDESRSPTTDYLSTEEDQLNSDADEVAMPTEMVGQEDGYDGLYALRFENTGGLEDAESESAALSVSRVVVGEAREFSVSRDAEATELVENEMEDDAKAEFLGFEFASAIESVGGETEEER